MTHLCDEAEGFAAAAIDGFCDVHARLVRRVPGGVVRATAVPAGKVAVVVGGGGGHYPAFAGYVGPGMADAAVTGDVFASPATRAVRDVAMRAHQGGGILLAFGNYAGDVLNFGLAADRLRSEGVDVRVLAVADDVASAAPDERGKRRGVAGNVTVFKIAGAAAEAGCTIDQVEALARRTDARTRSLGVAFGGCTLPGAAAPLFSVPAGRVAIGLGVHGEPGIDEAAMPSAAALGSMLVERLLGEAPERPGMRVAALLNGLGSTKHEELFVLWTNVAARLRAAGLTLVSPLVGEFMTSLDMAGCSLTLTWLDDELEPLWLAACDTAALRVGEAGSALPAPPRDDDAVQQTSWPAAGAASQAAGRAIADGFAELASALLAAEAELGRIDAEAGDGDHGQGMARGSSSAAAAAGDAAGAGAGAASVLAAAADAWADRAGGTSGAIWGLGLRAASAELDDRAGVTAEQVALAASRSLSQVMARGGAKPGDKTLVDAFAPFAETLTRAVAGSATLAAAWRAAAAAAEHAANATASLVPRLGRARPLAERSRGHRDAGAVSFALAAATILHLLEAHHD